MGMDRAGVHFDRATCLKELEAFGIPFDRVGHTSGERYQALALSIRNGGGGQVEFARMVHGYVWPMVYRGLNGCPDRDVCTDVLNRILERAFRKLFEMEEPVLGPAVRGMIMFAARSEIQSVRVRKPGVVVESLPLFARIASQEERKSSEEEVDEPVLTHAKDGKWLQSPWLTNKQLKLLQQLLIDPRVTSAGRKIQLDRANAHSHYKKIIRNLRVWNGLEKPPKRGRKKKPSK